MKSTITTAITTLAVGSLAALAHARRPTVTRG
jgi:hypothetical protein